MSIPQIAVSDAASRLAGTASAGAGGGRSSAVSIHSGSTPRGASPCASLRDRQECLSHTLSPRGRAVDAGLAGRGNVDGGGIAFYVEADAGRSRALRGVGMNRDRRTALCASPAVLPIPQPGFLSASFFPP